MPDQLQLRGGTTAEHTSFTGASKEVTIDTTKKTAVVHDASTAGGNPLMREDGANCALIDGSAAAPALAFAGDSANTGIYSPGTDQVAVSTNGVERVEWGTSEVVFNDGGENYDFRVEGDTNQNLLFLDASTERIGMGTGSPNALLHISRTVNSGDVGLIIQNTGTSSNTASIYLNKGSGAEPDHRIQNDTGGNLTFASGTDESTYSELMRIDSSGRLLVGTSNDLSGTSNTSVQIVGNTDNTNGELYLCRNDSTTASSNPIGTIEFRSNQGGTYESHARIQVQAEGGIGAGDKPGRIMFFTTPDGSATPAERMRITSAGRVGIGTTSPSGLLHIEGNTCQMHFTDTDDSSSSRIYNSGATFAIDVDHLNAKASSVFAIRVDDSERARIDSSGRLLVGTSTARTINGYDVWQGLQLAGATGNEAIVHERYSNDGGGAHLFFGKSRGSSVGSYTSVQSGDALGQIVWCGADGTDMGSSAASIRAVVDGTPGSNDMPGRLVFSTTADGASSPTERMRIDNGGSQHNYRPSAGTVINSRTGQSGTSGSTFRGYYSATNTTDGTVSFVVFANGNVQNTNNSYGAISDIKLKENIVGASSQWDDIKAIQVRNYNFKEGQTHTQIGVVAQEVELVSPGLVTESPDTDAEGNDLGTVTKSVNYSVLYMKAVKALQEAMERIETLEAKVAALEAN